MPSYEDELIKRARELQRLATVRRRLKRNLKKVDADIKAARKVLMAVKASSEGRRPDLAPSRLHAGVTAIGTSGVKAATSPRIIEKADSDPLGLDLKTEFEPVGVK